MRSSFSSALARLRPLTSALVLGLASFSAVCLHAKDAAAEGTVGGLSEEHFGQLFLDARDLPPGMTAADPTGGVTADDVSKGMKAFGKDYWFQKEENGRLLQVFDLRMVFDEPASAQRYLSTELGRLAEGEPADPNMPCMGQECHGFGSNMVSDGIAVKVYVYVIRVENVVAKLYISSMGPPEVSLLQVVPWARRAEERMRQATAQRQVSAATPTPAPAPAPTPAPVTPEPTGETTPPPSEPPPSPPPSSDSGSSSSSDDDDESYDDADNVVRFEVLGTRVTPVEPLPAAWGAAMRINGFLTDPEETLGFAMDFNVELGFQEYDNIPFDASGGVGFAVNLGPLQLSPLLGLGLDTAGGGDEASFRVPLAPYWFLEGRARLHAGSSVVIEGFAQRCLRGSIVGDANEVPVEVRFGGRLILPAFSKGHDLGVGLQVTNYPDQAKALSGFITYGL